MPAYWTIDNHPQCAFHFFLSHCAEDREKLVLPVFEQLQKEGLIPWIDKHHYPSGRESHEALRENLLRCRHIIYFITPAMLKQGRGWVEIEKAYGTLIQQSMRFKSMTLTAVELPLFFVPQTENTKWLPRSVWKTLTDNGKFISTGKHEISWAVKEIKKFIIQEQQYGEELAINLQKDEELRSYLKNDQNLIDRITGNSPSPFVPKRKE